MYNVFKIDACFDEYASYDVYVGGNSKTDILEHFDEIFPPTEITVDEFIIEDYPGHNVGDVIVEKQFTEKQMKEFEKNDKYWDRIKCVDHMFTDTPYTIIDRNSYIE